MLVIIPIAAIAVPAVFGLYYFINQRHYEKATITNAITEEMDRLKTVLDSHLSWIDKPTSIALPLVPFATPVYDAQLEKIGLLDPTFVKAVVAFYGMVKFVNALQQAKAEYLRVDGSSDRFVNSYKKAIRNTLDSERNPAARVSTSQPTPG
ncbi:MAG: hypothetical protein WAK16_06225 [Candidatus Cybelea sp.]